jgi:hypothetical protein
MVLDPTEGTDLAIVTKDFQEKIVLSVVLATLAQHALLAMFAIQMVVLAMALGQTPEQGPASAILVTPAVIVRRSFLQIMLQILALRMQVLRQVSQSVSSLRLVPLSSCISHTLEAGQT